MKTYSQERPLSLLPLGDGNWHYNYNVTEGVREDEDGTESPEWSFESVFIQGEPSVAKIVSAVVHERYTDEEIALMNAQHQAAAMGLDDEPEGYSDYLSLVAATRTEAATAISAMQHGEETTTEE